MKHEPPHEIREHIDFLKRRYSHLSLWQRKEYWCFVKGQIDDLEQELREAEEERNGNPEGSSVVKALVAPLLFALALTGCGDDSYWYLYLEAEKDTLGMAREKPFLIARDFYKTHCFWEMELHQERLLSEGKKPRRMFCRKGKLP